MQFAGHHRAKVVNLLAVGLHPFAVGAGHHVDGRRGNHPRAEELSLFAAHHILVSVAGDAQPGNNPDFVANGRQLLANGGEINGNGQIGRHLPADVATDHSCQHRRGRAVAPAPGYFAKHRRGGFSVQTRDACCRLPTLQALVVLIKPGAQVGRSPVNCDVARCHVISFNLRVELAIMVSAACSAASLS